MFYSELGDTLVLSERTGAENAFEKWRKVLHLTNRELQNWKLLAFGKIVSYASEYIRVLNYAGFCYSDRKTSVLELIINRPKITFGLNLPRCRNVYFLNLIIFLFSSVLKGKAIVLSGNQDLQNMLLSRGAKESSEGCKEDTLA